MGLDVDSEPVIYTSKMKPEEIKSFRENKGFDFEGLPDENCIWSSPTRKGVWEVLEFFSTLCESDVAHGEYIYISMDTEELKEHFIKESISPVYFQEGLNHLKEIILALEEVPEELNSYIYFCY